MKKMKWIILFLLLVIILGGAGGAWWYLHQQPAGKTKPAEIVDNKTYKYLTLDKVIVMLRGRAGEPLSHYLAVDLVFKVEEEHEKEAKEQLPFMRSLAVKALSSYTMEKAGMMSIEQFTNEINQAYTLSYKQEHRKKPFGEVMIGKLIIE